MKTILWLLFPLVLFSNNLIITKKDYIEPQLVLIKADSFYFGSDNGDMDEKPKHKVKIDKSFYMGKYEVTFDEYDKYCESVGRRKPKDNGWGRGKKPVIYVSFEDAKSYAKWLSDKTGKKYRLPTEKEWEYALKANSNTKYHFGNNIKSLRKYAWFDKNSFDLGEFSKYFGPQVVGQKLPNQNALFDMHGNVWEWVDSDYTIDHKTNKIIDENYKVLKGGCWASEAVYLRSSEREFEYRNYTSASDGFRLVREVD